jgi:hypothetical protein
MNSVRYTYSAALAATLRTTAAAYGYTLSTGATLALLTEMSGKPDVGRLFLFAGGGVLAFAVLEGFLAALGASQADFPAQAFPFAGVLNAASAAAALGIATLVTHFIKSSLAWFVAPIGTTAIYMLVVALQVTAVAAGQKRGSGAA